ncbi:MAG: hypothetical protein LC796_01300 [Acidobacteria bacterium]|nr:hypothetical protein [Acidobacteriota bacterium]MCA1610185.1 hypothetical protein [Acidobacteriota bacterium]
MERARATLGTAGTIHCGTTTEFDDDILYGNGTFIQWPRAQRSRGAALRGLQGGRGR